MRRHAMLLLVVLVLVASVPGCGDDDEGDEEAFCALLSEGVGIGSDRAEIDPSDFGRLLDVAPPEIRAAVRKLVNTARSLDEIPDTNLDELFAAAFDPDAIAAREELVGYAFNICDVDRDALVGGRIASDDVLITELVAYLAANFASERWIDAVGVTIVRDGTALHGLEIEMRRRTTRNEAIDVCNAVSVWLYSIKGASGPVSVVYDGTPVAGRVGPAASCDR